MRQRLRKACEVYPCDVLFVHRDAEKQPYADRLQEISTSLEGSGIPYIPVIPVRMMEAWLLVDEKAIRIAAGNPNGKDELYLPRIHTLEDLPDPKRLLHEALAKASGLNTGRSSRLRVEQRVHLIPNYIDDYSPLDALPAFQALQEDIRQLA